jgi:hypothetical protein
MKRENLSTYHLSLAVKRMSRNALSRSEHYCEDAEYRCSVCKRDMRLFVLEGGCGCCSIHPFSGSPVGKTPLPDGFQNGDDGNYASRYIENHI